MVSESPTGFLTFPAGTFQRTMRATREGAVRAINIFNCQVTHWMVMSDHMRDDKLDGHSFRVDEPLDVSISEAKPDQSLRKEDAANARLQQSPGDTWLASLCPEDSEPPEKIGALSTGYGMHAKLPPDAFTHFWAGAEATDGSTRHIEIQLKPGGQRLP